ncbi:MAG: tRNA pseudouridine(55) synthase TruB [Alphaproteobacteria bacterium]|nr:tRNA pseudouridine(55) synthase TruB [Alphaproteobacteria bacterium]
MSRRRRGLPLNGWLVLDKPAGMTSAQAVAAVRRITGAAKAGHGGTLDPLATGVLPVALGEATKTVGFALDADKGYRFRVRWGEARDTDDAEGATTATSDRRPSDAEIAAALPIFTGQILQKPPAYSAIKVAGERAYALARQGAPPELAPRQVEVHELRLVGRSGPDEAEFTILCSKGTYVRALVRDLGQRLGCFGHVVALRRTRAGPFREEQAISLEKLGELWQGAPPFGHLLPVETALDDIPALALTGPQADRLRSGQPIKVLDAGDGLVCAKQGGRAVALAEIAGGEVRPVRVFNL